MRAGALALGWLRCFCFLPLHETERDDGREQLVEPAEALRVEVRFVDELVQADPDLLQRKLGGVGRDRMKFTAARVVPWPAA